MLPLPCTAPSPSLAVSIDWVRGRVVLSGELDRSCAHHLVDALRALSVTDHACWLIDTAEVTWCDAGGLRALATAQALAAASGRELRLERPSRCVDRLVRLTGLDLLIARTGAPAGRETTGTSPGRRRTTPRTLTVVPATGS